MKKEKRKGKKKRKKKKKNQSSISWEIHNQQIKIKLGWDKLHKRNWEEVLDTDFFKKIKLNKLLKLSNIK